MEKKYEMKLNDDHTVTFWSVYNQRWETTSYISDAEYAAMPDSDRDIAIKHLYIK